VIVVDASIVANAIGDDGADGRAARDLLASDPDLFAPDLVDVETVAVLRKRWIAGALTAERFAHAVDDLIDLDIDRYPTLPLMRRAFELRDNVTPYDTAYVALAEGLECVLATADVRLSTAPGLRCVVRLLRSPPPEQRRRGLP